MAMKMKDFLSEFYKRLIFRKMTDSMEQFAQYCDYVKADDFNGNMKDWKKLLETDPATGKLDVDQATGLYKPKQLPDIAELDPNDLEKLYKAFQSAFRAMAADRDSLHKDTAGFLDRYFGKILTTTPPSSRMFDNASINPRAENLLKNKFLPLLKSKESEFANFILKPAGLLSDEFSFKDLTDGIRDGKYNTDAKFQRRLMQVVDYLSGYDEADLAKALKLRVGERVPDYLQDIRNGIDDAVKPGQLHNFELNYEELLRELYNNPKILNDFQRFDGGKISEPLNKAKEHLNYNDPNSDNFVKSKREDQLTIAQRIAEFAKDTYADYLEKYISLNGDRFFFSDSAKAIVSAMKKVKPTDGIEGLLKEAANLEKNLKASGKFTASRHAKWLTETLTELSNDKKMAKAFRGALQSSTQMKALVREIIFRAVKDGRPETIAAAKTAMEVLSVMKYGYTTSKIMDAIRKEPLTIFSDTGLSWNKNEGMQFVTRALDKSIKYAFVGLGYGLTFAGNAIRLAGSKIKKTKGKLNDQRKAIMQGYADDKQRLGDQIAAEEQNKQNMEAVVDRHLGTGTARMGAAAYTTGLNNTMNNANDARQRAKEDAIAKLDGVITWLQDPTNQSNPDYGDVYNYYNAVVESLDKNGDGYATLPPLPVLHDATGNVIPSPVNDIRTALQEMKSQSDDYNDANQKLTEFTDAQDTIAALSAQLATHNEEMSNWDDNHQDQVEELINYWNMLEKGRNTRSGPMYGWVGRKKKREKQFNSERDDIIKKALENKIRMS